MTDQQHEVIEFLANGASYGRVCPVERIETHCSIVFLAGDRAYKLKRAIRYASLDYTTRDRRQAACASELLLNRRTAPDLYLGVRSITRETSGNLAFDGAGSALDHVVVMRRFAQSDLLDDMADRGRLTRDMMRALGEAVGQFHHGAERRADHGGSDAIRRVIGDNDRELAKVATELDGAAVGTLGGLARNELDTIGTLLEKRRRSGKVRRCHGDLRLANIVLFEGRPTPFDCIEFSDDIGCIDVLYDLAFLLMDLLLRDRPDLGSAVFNAYLDLAPETEGLGALPLFLALRAATRSYALAGSASRNKSPRQVARLLAQARRHIDAGIRFLAPRHPVLIAVGGEADRVKTDFAVAIAALAQPAPGARILHDAGIEQALSILSTGHSVLLEAKFADAAERIAAFEVSSKYRIPMLGIWLGAPPGAPNWHYIDPKQGALAALARAAPLITATAVRN